MTPTAASNPRRRKRRRLAPVPGEAAGASRPKHAKDLAPTFARSEEGALPQPLVHASETGGGAGTATAEDRRRRSLFPSLATLLAGHVLRDGEVVLLILKPSVWFILFSVMRFSAAVLIVVIAANLWLDRRFAYHWVYAGAFAIGVRLMWAVLVWIGRLYILTDGRILRLSGVFTVEIFDCPLRKVGQTRVTYSFRERLWRLGSIEITPADESRPPGVWQTIRRPVQVHEQIQDAIRRAKEGGWGEECVVRSA